MENTDHSRGKSVPHDIGAERSVLGAVILDSDAADTIIADIRPEHFYRAQHARIYDAMRRLHAEGKAIDEVLIVSTLRSEGLLEAAGGASYVAELIDACPSVANIKHHIDVVLTEARARQVLNIAGKLAESAALGGNEVTAAVAVAQADFSAVAETAERNMPRPIKDVLRSAIQSLEKKYDEGNAISGLSTGFADLDKMTSGLKPGALVIIGGRSSMGKTTLALNMVEATAINDKSAVLVFSIETPAEDLVYRMLSAHGRIDNDRVQKPRSLQEADWIKLASSAQVLASTRIWIDHDSNTTIHSIRSKAKYVLRKDGLDLIVVDYLGMVMPEKSTVQNREREVAKISRDLKLLAMEFGVPIIALCQLNRQFSQRADKRPLLSDLRDSGSLEQDADVVMFVYREVRDNPDTEAKDLAEIILAKQRNGAIGTVMLRYFDKYTRFENLTRAEAYHG